MLYAYICFTFSFSAFYITLFHFYCSILFSYFSGLILLIWSAIGRLLYIV